MKKYSNISKIRITVIIFTLSLCLALQISYPIAIAQEGIKLQANHSLVLLYADLDDALGLTYYGLQDSQHSVDSDLSSTLRAEIRSQIAANPDLTIRLIVAQSQNSKIYTISANTEEQVEDWSELDNPFDNLTTWLAQSIQSTESTTSVSFALVDYDNGWLQSVRPVIDHYGQPCIANPANWHDDGRPDLSDNGGRPIPGGSSHGIGHTDLERALCDVQRQTSQKIGLLRLDTVLDFLADRTEVGTCSSLDSLLPHISIKPQYINVSSTSGGKVAGIPFQARDILRYDMTNNLWNMLFDASDVGINKGNLDAFHVMADRSILLSLSKPLSLPGVGRVDDSDIVRFVPTQLGFETAGHFDLYFDGSDVKLTRGSEDIDAISMLPDGSLLISTVGNVSVDGVRKGRDEDVLLFDPISIGEDTQGQWSLYLDGSKVGLKTRNENIVGIDYDPSLPEREALHLATRGRFVAPRVRGANPDILSYAPDEASQCTFEISQRWNDFKGYFASEKLDGISYQIGNTYYPFISAADNTVQSMTAESSIEALSESYQLYLPIISH